MLMDYLHCDLLTIYYASNEEADTADSQMMISLSLEQNPIPPRVVAFTTPQNYAARLSNVIQLRGWTALWCPTITVESTPQTISNLQHSISSSLHHCSAIAFTSRTGITAFVEALNTLNTPPLPPQGKIFTILALGKDSELLDANFASKLCENPGRIKTLIPRIATPSGIVESMGIGEGKIVFCPVPIVLGIEEPPVVPKFLADLDRKGWIVVRANAYETRWNKEINVVEELVRRIERFEVDAIVFTSSGEVEGMLRSLGRVGMDWETVRGMSPGMVVAAHGPVTASGAERLGVGVDVVSGRFDSFDGVVEALYCRWKPFC